MIQLAVALEKALVASGNLQEAIVSWKENGNLTYRQPNLVSMDDEPAETNRSPASTDSSNGFIPQLIEELFRLNQGKQGSITSHVQK